MTEDGDNSSSGVSSDQEIPVGPPAEFDDIKHNTKTEQQYTVTAIKDKEKCCTKKLNYGGSGVLTRHAVSLAQLPPPIETEAEEQNNSLFVPPPPEFNAEESSGGHSADLVFAPPPQFCDNRHHLQSRMKFCESSSQSLRK